MLESPIDKLIEFEQYIVSDISQVSSYAFPHNKLGVGACAFVINHDDEPLNDDSIVEIYFNAVEIDWRFSDDIHKGMGRTWENLTLREFVDVLDEVYNKAEL